MNPADQRVIELVDRWITSLELHLKYVSLSDEAYWQVQPWTRHQRPARWILDLARTRARELRRRLDERLTAQDAGFAEGLELMAFLANLVGVQNIERFIPLAEPERENREVMGRTQSTPAPLLGSTSTQTHTIVEPTREMRIPVPPAVPPPLSAAPPTVFAPPPVRAPEPPPPAVIASPPVRAPEPPPIVFAPPPVRAPEPPPPARAPEPPPTVFAPPSVRAPEPPPPARAPEPPPTVFAPPPLRAPEPPPPVRAPEPPPPTAFAPPPVRAPEPPPPAGYAASSVRAVEPTPPTTTSARPPVRRTEPAPPVSAPPPQPSRAPPPAVSPVSVPTRTDSSLPPVLGPSAVARPAPPTTAPSGRVSPPSAPAKSASPAAGPAKSPAETVAPRTPTGRGGTKKESRAATGKHARTPAPGSAEAQIFADAVRLLKWGRQWHELSEAIARIAGRPGIVEIRKCLRTYKAEIEKATDE